VIIVDVRVGAQVSEVGQLNGEVSGAEGAINVPARGSAALLTHAAKVVVTARRIDQRNLLGTSVSHGCVRISNTVITRLAKMLPLGTPVQTAS
jgi:hypothetical protein